MNTRAPRLLALAVLAAVAVAPPSLRAQPQPGDAAEADTEPTEAGAPGESGAEGEDAAPPPEDDAADLDSLRARYHELRDRLFQSRARAAAVASALYSTRIRLDLRYDSGRFYTVTRASLRLDGATVFDDVDGVIARDDATRFEGFVAPGRHVVGVRVEARGKDDTRFTTATETSFVIDAPAGKDVVVTAVASDEGDIAFAWSKKQRGTYKLHIDVDVATRARDEGSKGHIQRTGRRRAKSPVHASR